ncbi:MAG: hypothetical protein JNM10_01310 [Planctomycetia bacterium]|nr:hypothetical protein [Planctomycetia bacterium]
MRQSVHVAIAAGLALAVIGVGALVIFGGRREEDRPVEERLSSKMMSGVVVRPDGTPVAGVTVRGSRGDGSESQDRSTVSESDGRFALEVEGYAGLGHVEAVIGERTVAHAEAILAYGEVTVLVVRAESVAWAKLRVRVVHEEGSPPLRGYVIARNGVDTDMKWLESDGSAVMEVAPGPNGVYAWDATRCGAALVDVPAGGAETEITIGGSTVFGRVRPADRATEAEVELWPSVWGEHPLTGRRVPVPLNGLEGQDGGRWRTASGMELIVGGPRATPNAAGEFRFDGVSPRTAWWVSFAHRFEDAGGVGRVEARGGEAPVILERGDRLHAASLRVEPVDARGEAVAIPADVTTPGGAARAVGSLSLRSETLGSHEFTLEPEPGTTSRLVVRSQSIRRILAGTYEAEVRLRGYQRARVDGTVVVPAEEPLRVRVQPGIQVTGTVRRTDGVRVAEGGLWLHRDGAREADAAVATARIDRERYEVHDLAPGVYDVVVADAGRPRTVAERLVVPEGAGRMEHDVVTRPGARVVVMFAAGARLTSDVSLRVVPSGGGAAIRFARTADELTRVNPWGGHGSFPVLDGLAPGRYTLEGTWDGRPMPSRTIDLAAGATAVVALPLK